MVMVDGTRITLQGGSLLSGIENLMARSTDGDTIIEDNTYGTAGAEMRIVLDPLISLQGGDFLL